MNARRVRRQSPGVFLVLACLCLVLVGATASFGGTSLGELRLSGEAEIGGRAISGRDWSSAKYEEYREQRPGLFGGGHFLLEHPDSDGYLRALLHDVAERDARYELEVGRWGGSRLRAWFHELPHTYSRQALSFFDPGTDEELVAEGLRGVSLRTRLRDGGVGLRIRPEAWRSWEFESDYRIQERRGTLPFSIGFGNPGDGFVNFARPVDETTHEFTTTARWVGEAATLEVGYLGSWFRNEYERLVVPNTPTASTFGLAQEGQISLAPDNAAHNFRVSGGADLPLAIPARLSATFAYGWREQDEEFLCHTINRAIAGSDLIGDDCGRISGNPLAGDFNLPADSLDGEIETLLGNVVLTLQPIRPLRITARYRIYDYANDTPELRFPDHVENDTFAVTDEARISIANSYRRQNASLEAALRLRKDLRLRTEYTFEQWTRGAESPVRDLDEHGGRIRLDWRPHPRWQARAGYQFGVRRGNGYDPFAPLDASHDPGALDPMTEASLIFPELRKADLANRQWDRFDLHARWAATERFSIGLFGRYEQYDYDDTDFGLLGDERLSLGGDASWQVTERVGLSAWYTFEDLKQEMQARFRPRDFLSPPTIVDMCAAPAVPDCNDWNSLEKDQIHNVGFRIDWELLPKRLDASLTYEFQKARSKSRSDNDGVPQGIGFIAGAQGLAWNYPGTGDQRHGIGATLAYHVNEALTARLFYSYEQFDLTDFRIDDLTVFGPPRPGETDVFLNERIDDYRAHVFGVSLAYSF